MAEMTPTRPVLRYHGGKFILAPWIVSHFPPHRIYVEPYCGAASVLMHKPRSFGEVINDLDGEIVNVFRVLRDPCQARELERVLRLTPFSRSEFELARIPDGDPIEQARRTIARSFMGFGGTVASKWRTGFRSFAWRCGSAPVHDWSKYPDTISQFIDRLRNVVIESRPALFIITQQDSPETLFYIDPPYPFQSRSRRWANHVYHTEMSDGDHRDLAAVLKQIDGMAIVSGYHCPLYDELFTDWQHFDHAAMADGARRRVEVLWLSPAVSKCLIQKELF